MREGVILKTGECITETALQETACRRFPVGTVLVAMYGGFAQIGRTGRLGVEAASNQAVSALTELAQTVDPEYIHQVLKTGRGRWKRVAASTRKDPNITKADVEAFEFPCPPLAEQKDILDLLAIHEEAVKSARTSVQAVTTLAREIASDALRRST